jgi:hypothetical protein
MDQSTFRNGYELAISGTSSSDLSFARHQLVSGTLGHADGKRITQHG